MNRGPAVAYALALAVDAAGAAGTLLIAVRDWQTVRTDRPAPLHTDVLPLSGRTVDAAPTAFALVALAGVVAVIATRATTRRAVGVVLVLAGAGIVWRALASASAVSPARARSLVESKHRTVDAGAVVPHVAVHAVWPTLTVVCGVLVAAAGVLVAVRGHRWHALSARYERSATGGTGATATAGARDAQGTATAAPVLWSALDRGDDPTVGGVDGPDDGPATSDVGGSRYPRS